MWVHSLTSVDAPSGDELADPPGPRPVGRPALWAFVSQASVAVINLPVTFMLARSLSPTGLGGFQLLNRIALITISVAHLGYPHAFVWRAGRADGAADLRGLCRKALTLSVVQGGLVFAAFLALALSGLHPVGMIPWLAIGAYPLFNILMANIVGIYRGTLAISTMAAIRVSQALVWLGATAYFFLAHRLTVEVAVLVLLTSQVVSVVVAFILTLVRKLVFGPRTAVDSISLRRFSLRVFPGLTIRDWNLYLDQIIVGVAFGHHALGLYAVAVSVTISLSMLAAPFINTAQPVVQQAAREARIKTSARLLAASLGVVVPPAVCLTAASPFLVPWLYGHAYSHAVVLAQILFLATALDVVNATVHGILLGLDRPSASSRATTAGFGANVLCWLVLLPTLGVTGAALTSVVAYGVVTFLMARFLLRALHCTLGDLLVAIGQQSVDYSRQAAAALTAVPSALRAWSME